MKTIMNSLYRLTLPVVLCCAFLLGCRNSTPEANPRVANNEKPASELPEESVTESETTPEPKQELKSDTGGTTKSKKEITDEFVIDFLANSKMRPITVTSLEMADLVDPAINMWESKVKDTAIDDLKVYDAFVDLCIEFDKITGELPPIEFVVNSDKFSREYVKSMLGNSENVENARKTDEDNAPTEWHKYEFMKIGFSDGKAVAMKIDAPAFMKHRNKQ